MGADLTTFLIAGLAFLAVVGVGFALAGGEGEAAKKRARAIGAGATLSGKGRNAKVMDDAAKRRAKTQEMLDSLRKQGKERKKIDSAQTIKAKLTQAGMNVPVSTFWIFSLILGVVIGAVVFMSGADGLVVAGMSLKSRPLLVLGAFAAGAFGLPRFLLNSRIKGRHKKMLNQFADGLDIIVRGVKSGLSLNECIRIISKESPEPLRSEFATLADNLSMGAGTERSLNSFYKRIPLQEVNFFVIVLLIQSKAGGNLSEALGNLSSVIRSRKMMREKIKAMSSEAKASAGIIGSLPFVVGLLVFLSTPGYIMELFITETGHVCLASGALLMTTGILTMRKMINFDM
ncbi:MAG: type II secretion system F family protein [Hyphomonas sp.]|uniref:type II secretion system F family protein n=1 Tax=Hyphomonas sp. TaxID=87 RepID=UPI0035277474